MDFPFTNNDKAFIRAVAPFFGDIRRLPTYTGISEELGITRDEAVGLFTRLSHLGLVAGHTNESFRVNAKVVRLIHDWDNPPPKDHWKDLETWFRSRRWSLPLLGIVVLAPILVQWVEWIWKLITMFTEQGKPQ